MTYAESAALMADIPFRDRIMIACLTYADYVQGTPPELGKNTALAWAQHVFKMPQSAAGEIQPQIVMDQAVQSAGADITDAALQTVVETVVKESF